MASNALRDNLPAYPKTIVMGTAQLGLDYGISNRVGKPSQDEADRLLDAALAHGLLQFDTARAYGDAEDRLGRWMKARGVRAQVSTKLTPDLPLHNAATAAQMSVQASLNALNLTRLDSLLLHRADHRSLASGAAWQQLKALKERGIVGALGVSVQTPQEALSALNDPDVKKIQLPFNILDQRWKIAGVPDAALARRDIEIEARSCLLQGLITLPAQAWPQTGASAQRIKENITDLAKRFSGGDFIRLAYAYVLSQPWITSVVIGMATPEQVAANADRLSGPPLPREALQEIETLFQSLPDALLDPSQWRYAP